MTTQPLLPNPVPYSVVERAYIEDSPSGLWPDNQDSNFGIHRKIFCDRLMDAVSQLQIIFNEMFPATSTQFIANWEEQMGLSINPPGRTLAQRQAAVIARSRRGAFTRTGRRAIIEGYIEATFGVAPAFGAGGIVLGSGVPLFSGVGGDPTLFYRIIEDIINFKYHVWIDNRVVVDLVALNQELLRYTPAGIQYDISTLYQKQNGGKSPAKGGGITGNLLANGTFEAGITGWSSMDGISTLLQSNTHVNPAGGGAQALRVTPGPLAGSGLRTTGNALTTGGKYNTSTFVWAPASQAMTVKIFRADFVTVVATASFVGNGAFQGISLPFTAPATETEYIFVQPTAAGGAPFWVDDVSLWRSS